MGNPKEQTKEQPKEQTYAERFALMVQKEFTAELGDALKFTDYEKTLAQHMYAKIDASLKGLEAKRDDKNYPTPFSWENINLQKLALDSVHRIGLGLDALIPNHIHPIPYFNKALKKYDLDLRIGYVGKDYCRRNLAIEKPLEVIYQLVHKSDIFKPIMKSAKNEVEGYEFEITSPFDRGEVIGGFGYILYSDPPKNKLVLVDMKDFQKAEAVAKTKDFWANDKWREEMQYKTIVHRVADKLPLDPKKVNAKSFAYVEDQENEERFGREANSGNVVDISGKVVSESEPPKPVENTKSTAPAGGQLSSEIEDPENWK